MEMLLTTMTSLRLVVLIPLSQLMIILMMMPKLLLRPAPCLALPVESPAPDSLLPLPILKPLVTIGTFLLLATTKLSRMLILSLHGLAKKLLLLLLLPPSP